MEVRCPPGVFGGRVAHLKRWFVRVLKKLVLFPFLVESNGDRSIAACHMEKNEVVTQQAGANKQSNVVVTIGWTKTTRAIDFVPDAHVELWSHSLQHRR